MFRVYFAHESYLGILKESASNYDKLLEVVIHLLRRKCIIFKIETCKKINLLNIFKFNKFYKLPDFVTNSIILFCEKII